MSERSVCEYCSGYTLMDGRGNCIACGAPKRRNTKTLPQMENWSVGVEVSSVSTPMVAMMTTAAMDYMSYDN